MSSTVTVTAPSRLHFGLLGFGDADGRQFGGVGVMIEQPALRLRISRADRPSVQGQASKRIEHYVQHWSEFHGLSRPAACRIDVIHAPRTHAGLGSGTQLGLAVAAGLNRLFEREMSVVDTARSVGRGLRSAVGTYGFFQGGLIWERGKSAGEALSPLTQRLPIPDAWRFVVICPQQQPGLSGEAEQSAMASLPPVPPETQQRLSALVEERMLPALARQACDEFGEAVFEYGRRAGEAFAPIQGGAYNGVRLEQIVERLRAAGGVGVGQSSWGPALYVIVPDNTTANLLVDRLRSAGDLDDADIWISAPDNQGARIAVEA